MKSRKNKTYKGKPTKHIQAQTLKLKKVFLISLAVFLSLGALYDLNKTRLTEYTQTGEKAHHEHSVTSEDVVKEEFKMVELVSNNYQKEIELRQAAKQACEYVNAEQWGIQDQCEKDLLGIAWAETWGDPFNCQQVGDLDIKGSYGCFQINKHFHAHVTREQAEDPYWAAIWTIKRLVAKGYPVYRSNAIRSHNGSINNPVTKTYLDKVNQVALR